MNWIIYTIGIWMATAVVTGALYSVVRNVEKKRTGDRI